ncbi:MAG TPA: DedA family protein [Anaerolineales bacterium]|nr:DedA family protein [Anaerolineales bacterium]
MITELETFILSTIQTLYDAWGWFGVAALLTFENATGITPSEIILGLAGWMLISEHQLPPTLIFVGGFYSAIGSTLGASIGYWAARLGGRPLIDKLARWVRIPPAHITLAENQFHRWGAGLVLVGRVIPGVRTLVSIPAGLARMPFFTFFVATLIGAYIWCTLLIGAGYALGHEWPIISQYLKRFFPYVAAFGAAAYLAYLLIRRSVLSRSTLDLGQP